jgi:hypothetical protein
MSETVISGWTCPSGNSPADNFFVMVMIVIVIAAFLFFFDYDDDNDNRFADHDMIQQSCFWMDAGWETSMYLTGRFYPWPVESPRGIKIFSSNLAATPSLVS